MTVANYLAVSGLPSTNRAICALLLGAAHENATATAHPEFWAKLGRLMSDTNARQWELSDTDPSFNAVGDDSPSSRKGGGNVCSTDVAPLATALLEVDPHLRVLVLYQSPWEAFHEACRLHGLRGGEAAIAWLGEWLDYHRAVLGACALAPARMFLVNAGRLGSRDAAHALLEALRTVGIAVPDVELADQLDLVVADSSSDLLSRQMGDFGPEYWDMYEALESSALLLGRDPEFRTSVPEAEENHLSSLLSVWGDAISAREGDLLEMWQQADEQDQDKAIAPSGANRTPLHNRRAADSLMIEIQTENELLVRQLQQTQEELELYVSSSEEMRASLESSGQVAERARMVISELFRQKQSPEPR